MDNEFPNKQERENLRRLWTEGVRTNSTGRNIGVKLLDHIDALERQMKLLGQAYDASRAFIDCHAADPDITLEMRRKYAQYPEAKAAIASAQDGR